MIVIGSIAIVTGTVLSLLAAIGVLTFPSPLARMHAATKSASLGLAFITVGAGFLAESLGMIGIGALVTVFLFVTAPISGHMVGRAAYRGAAHDGLAHDDLAGIDPEPVEIDPPTTRRFSPARWGAVVIVWMLLWRDLSLANVVGGALVATMLEALRSTTGRVLPVKIVPALRLLGFYLWQLLRSNARVAWEVITPDDSDIAEGIVACPLASPSHQVALLVANAVTFAPGTLSLELAGRDPFVLYVHVLHFESQAAVRREIAELESRVRAAFGEEPVGAPAE